MTTTRSILSHYIRIVLLLRLSNSLAPDPAAEKKQHMVNCNLLTSVGVIETVNKIIDNFLNLLITKNKQMKNSQLNNGKNYHNNYIY